MEDTKVVDLQEVKNQQSSDDDVSVTRGELKEVLGQIMENMNQMSGYLMEDMNALFRNHVYPIKVKLQAMSELFAEKEFISEKDVEDRAQQIHNKTVEEAKAQLEKEQEDAKDSCDCGDTCECDKESCKCGCEE